MDYKEYTEKIKQELTIEQVNQILNELGGNPQIKNNNIIVSRTICHNGDSHKLYYYSNTHLFKCFTECAGDSFDIYDLVIKVYKTHNLTISLPQAVQYVIKFFNLPEYKQNSTFEENNLQDWDILNRYEGKAQEEEEKRQVELKIYDNKILKYLPHPRILPWEKEGITREVMEYCGICYDPSAQGIVIPHYDADNNLIGIRERTLIKENEEYGKYRPAYINYQLYNHPLGFALYGLNWAKDNISKIKKAIIMEGEKSVLKYMSWFGIDNNIMVAACGSNLTQYQVDLLLNLGVEEIIIGFDRQFKDIGDKEWKQWTEKLTALNNKYSKFVNISFIFDKNNLLGYKDSPVDKTKEIFLRLFYERVVL